MSKFTVLVREIHVSHREVEADSAEMAVEMVKNHQDEEVFLEYSDTLNPDKWSVEDADGNIVIDVGDYLG